MKKPVQIFENFSQHYKKQAHLSTCLIMIDSQVLIQCEAKASY